MPEELTAAEVAFYRTNGYVAIDRLLTAEEVDALVQRVHEIVDLPIRVEPVTSMCLSSSSGGMRTR